MNQRNSSIRSSPFALRHSGMTLVELLIVIVIIGVLISVVLVASTSLIGKSKARNTQAVLQIVADAAEQFKRSESEKPTLTRNAKYKARYGLYPPDELEVFSATPPSKAGSAVPHGLATPAGSTIVPTPPYPAMRFYADGSPDDSFEHRDLAALIVAIESQGGEAAAILDRISDRNRSIGVLDSQGNPAQFLSRPLTINEQQANATWDSEDLQIRYILDDWGNPIGYMAQRDFNHDDAATTASSNHPAWNQVSTEIRRLNGDQPVIFSYGPNGKDQLTQDAMGTEAEAKASLPGDFADHMMNHPFNDDNVYLNEQLREKLSKGIEDHG
jgi:prepilin-type N-terminal cleavage/methylation domain-containing protein